MTGWDTGSWCSGLISQWGSTIKSPWVWTLTRQQYPYWYNLRCCQDINLQQPTNQIPTSTQAPTSQIPMRAWTRTHARTHILTRARVHTCAYSHTHTHMHNNPLVKARTNGVDQWEHGRDSGSHGSSSKKWGLSFSWVSLVPLGSSLSGIGRSSMHTLYQQLIYSTGLKLVWCMNNTTFWL